MFLYSNQEVEDAETEQIECDTDVAEVVETRQHANTKTETQQTQFSTVRLVSTTLRESVAAPEVLSRGAN